VTEGISHEYSKAVKKLNVNVVDKNTRNG